MISQDYIDCSNFTASWTPAQLAYLHDNVAGVVIGLQDAAKARDFQAQAISIGLERAFYVDIPGRDLTIPEPGSYCFVDIEPGCFETWILAFVELAKIRDAGLREGVYCNETSLRTVGIGPGTDLSPYTLWYANYQSSRPTSNVLPVPFNGWTSCLMWQWSNQPPPEVPDLNVDRNMLFLPDPPPAPPTVTHTIQILSDGSYKEV